MKRYKYYAILCCLLLAAACHKDDDDKLPPGKYPLEITAHLADGFSRSVPGKDTWTGGEKVRVIVRDDGGDKESIYTMAADGTMTSDTPLYWESKERINVSAYYPAESTGWIDISDQSGGFAAFDYLQVYASGNSFGQPIELQFRHCMAKVRVELVTAVEVEKVGIMGNRTIKFNGKGNIYINDSGDRYITACRDGDSGDYEALVVPYKIQSSTDFIKVTAADGKEYFYSAGEKMLNSGNTYVYKIGVGCTVHQLAGYNDITITGDGKHVVYGNGTTYGKITVDGNATIELHDVNISPAQYSPAIEVTGGKPTFVLFGNNTLTGTVSPDDFYNYPALYNASGTEITITGEGSLNASGGRYCAAIGAGNSSSAGKIVIKGGNINVSGGENAAGIGCGYSTNCEGISILGGKIIAYGGSGSGAIGNGRSSTCAKVELANCEIRVYALTGNDGINATAITPSLDDKSALTTAGVKIYVNGVLYNT